MTARASLYLMKPSLRRSIVRATATTRISAVDRLLHVRIHVHQDQPVVQGRDDQRAQRRVLRPPDASREGDAAHGGRRDGGEKGVGARARMRAAQPRGQEEGREAVQHPGHGEDEDLHPVHLDARLPGQCLVPADGVDVAAEPRAVLDDLDDHEQGDRDEGDEGNAEDLAVHDVLDAGVQQGDRRRLVDVHGQAVQGPAHPERADEGRDPQLRVHEPIHAGPPPRR